MTNKDFLIEINSLTEPLSQVLGDLEENWKTSSIRVKEARAAVETAFNAVENLQIDDALVEESLLNVSAKSYKHHRIMLLVMMFIRFCTTTMFQSNYAMSVLIKMV